MTILDTKTLEWWLSLSSKQKEIVTNLLLIQTNN